VPRQVASIEREALKAVLQLPAAVAKDFDELGDQAFLVAVHGQIQQAIARSGGAAQGVTGPAWIELVSDHLPAESEARGAVIALAVEPMRAPEDGQLRYAKAMVDSLAEQAVSREVARVKSRVQRLDASDLTGQEQLFAELMELEKRRRDLRARAIGDQE
jgi:DNA primase